MTEQEWLSCSKIESMLEAIVGNVSNRKLRLFAVGCCRRAWPSLDERNRRAIEVAERFADGEVGQKERQAAYAQRRWFPARSLDDTGIMCAHRITRRAADAASSYSVLVLTASQVGMLDAQAFWEARLRAEEELCHVLRCIIGNPRRPAKIKKGWLTWTAGTIPKLAQDIYTDRAFDRLPVLADALEDAGCDNADILAHCRGPGPHARGCWVVDLILGKS
jgi:hypothetical protein